MRPLCLALAAHGAVPSAEAALALPFEDLLLWAVAAEARLEAEAAARRAAGRS